MTQPAYVEVDAWLERVTGGKCVDCRQRPVVAKAQKGPKLDRVCARCAVIRKGHKRWCLKVLGADDDTGCFYHCSCDEADDYEVEDL